MKRLRRSVVLLLIPVAAALAAPPVHSVVTQRRLTAPNNPLAGYADFSATYLIPYAAGSGLTSANGPFINATIAGNTIELPVDTGSRALYVSQDLVPNLIDPEGPAGFVYLNSSARIFQGSWTTQTITFPDAVPTNAPSPATAVVPVLVVDTLACSTTPSPGASVASATFATLVESGSVTLTDGASVSFSNFTLTLTGGQAVAYATNPGILAPVKNLGVGFDRTGQGASPNDNAHNQQYNAFLNATPMRAASPTMRAGYVLSAAGVQLGLTAADSGYAYTNLLPTGLAQNPPSPPDWQAPMGNLVFQGVTYTAGQLVVDTGIDFGILTLPRLLGPTANPPVTVNLLNSQGAVSYEITSDVANPLNPTSLLVFPPLAGSFSENAGLAQTQFFNTGRRVLNAFTFLYDGAAGYIGLRPTGAAAPGANVRFAAAFYPAALPTAPTTLTLPLQVVNIGTNDAPKYKFGIYVGLGGGPPKLYEFDTGGSGFFAAENSVWWPGTTPLSSTPVTVTYSSGASYTSNAVNTTVSIYESAESAQPVASVRADIGQIIDASGGPTDWAGYQADPNTPPLYNVFYGDFGALLQPFTATAPNPDLYGVLPQLPGSLSRGFIVRAGDYANPQPTLQLGLTDADRAGFPIQLPLLDQDTENPFPGSGWPTYGFFQVWGYFTLNSGGVTQTSATQVILDTGAPSMTIRTTTSSQQVGSITVNDAFLNNGGGAIESGVAFSLASGAWTLAFTAGDEVGLNKVEVGESVNANGPAGYINTGLNAFFAFDVMYDVQRGVIGFLPDATPAPLPAPAPVVRIDGPATVRTSRKSIEVRGTVRSVAPVATVQFRRAGFGYQRTQGGAKRWNFTVPLGRGRNVFHVRAINREGTAGRAVRVVAIRR